MRLLLIFVVLSILKPCNKNDSKTVTNTVSYKDSIKQTNPDTSECIGQPIKDCLCIQVYDPVCGCDGKTYSNSCVAKCAGIKLWTKGPCNSPND